MHSADSVLGQGFIGSHCNFVIVLLPLRNLFTKYIYTHIQFKIYLFPFSPNKKFTLLLF
jgi:hypothetical protein